MVWGTMRNGNYRPGDHPPDESAPVFQPYGLLRLAIVVAATAAFYWYAKLVWGFVFSLL